MKNYTLILILLLLVALCATAADYTDDAIRTYYLSTLFLLLPTHNSCQLTRQN